MNQSFGGAFLIKIALIFLSIYIFVMGFAINYAKVFSLKNKIITLIEEYEGYDAGNTDFMDKINNEINKLNYSGLPSNSSDGDIAAVLKNAGVNNISECVNSNKKMYCIIRHDSSEGGDPASPISEYYRVITYIHFEIPIVTDIARGNIPVSGETRSLYRF